MRFSVLFVVLSTAFASASAVVFPRQLPACATDCLAAGPRGNCALTDNVCMCHNTAFIDQTTLCIQQNCSASDASQAEAYSRSLCAAVGVTLTSTPSLPSSTGTSSNSSSTGTPSSSSSSPATTSQSSSKSNGETSHRANVLLGLATAGLMTLLL